MIRLSKIVSLLFISMSMGFLALAQTDESLLPQTSTKSALLFADPATMSLTFDATNAANLDQRDDKHGHAPKFARSIITDLSLSNSGTWTTLPNGDRVWRLLITSSGALALIPCYDIFYLPLGATFHLYTPKRDEMIGAYTQANNPDGGSYNTGLIHGSTCILEYYEPLAVLGKGVIHINEVGYAYRLVPKHKSTPEFGTSSPCEVNVKCSEGNNWQDQINSVVRILTKDASGFGWCSGALVNNTNQDCSPYILSADHCYQNDQTGSIPSTADLSQWMFYFNYQSPTCNNPANDNGLTSQAITGCTLMAASLDTGGNSGSDFVLLKMSSNPPASYRPYYAGWTNLNISGHAGVSIHHPSADIKKISTYGTDLISVTWGGVAFDTHWEVHWLGTTHGHGVTEPGSSGSPIFDGNKHIIGTLTGGGSDCTQVDTTDQYGKFSYHWMSNGSTSNKRLKNWLDPTNTGIKTLDGMYPPCAASQALDAGIPLVSPIGNICDPNVVVSATLKNFGTATLTSATITFTIDGTPQTLNWSGTLTSFQSTVVSLPSQTFSAGQHTISIASSAPNTGLDANQYNDSHTATFFVVPAGNQYAFHLQTDDFGSQTTWQLIDANYNVLYTGGPYTDQSSGQAIDQTWCLPAGCYTFGIFDIVGDGVQGNQLNGNFTIKNSANIVVAQLQNINFGTQETDQFCVTNTGINDLSAPNAAISIYPNPSTGLYAITNMEQVTTVKVLDDLGRVITSLDVKGQHSTSIDLSHQSAGVYLFKFEAETGVVVKKIVLNSSAY